MPVEGAASFEVLVGGAPCHEYAHDGKTYVEMDLQHAVLEAERWRKRKEELEQRVTATGKDLARRA